MTLDITFLVVAKISSEVRPESQLVALLHGKDIMEYLQRLVANIPWGHNILLMQKIKDLPTRFPSPQSDMAQQALKNPYIFDFPSLTEPFQERELEAGLVQHLEKFLIELGQGFAFVGRQFGVFSSAISRAITRRTKG